MRSVKCVNGDGIIISRKAKGCQARVRYGDEEKVDDEKRKQ